MNRLKQAAVVLATLALSAGTLAFTTTSDFTAPATAIAMDDGDATCMNTTILGLISLGCAPISIDL